MKISIRKIALLFILLENLYVPLNLGFDFRLIYVLYFLFIAAFPFLYRRVKINATLAYVFMGVTTVLIASSALTGGVVDALRQVVLISYNILFAYLLLSAYEYDIRLLFKDYIDLIYVAAIVGLVQFVSQLLGFRYGADYSFLGFDMQNFSMDVWVVQSWFQEPSYLGTAFLPVAFAAICRLMKLTEIISKQKAVVVLLVLGLSQAATGLIGVVLAIGLIVTTRYSVVRSPVLMAGATLLIVITSVGIYSIPKVRMRLDDTAKLFFDEHVSASDIESVNASTYAIYSNFRVVSRAFLDHPLLGAGLGSYETIYDHYIHQVLPANRMTESLQLNKRDANSLLLRLAAETGIVGMVTFFFIVWFNRIRNANLFELSAAEIDYWIINSGIFVVIVVRLIRLGHYTTLGFVLMLAMYFLSKKYYVMSYRRRIGHATPETH